MDTEPEARSPMPGDQLPRIAYIMSRFPKLTETFVLYEMQAIEAQGGRIDPYPLLLDRGAKMHREAMTWLERGRPEPLLSWPIVRAGLLNTVLLSLLVVPLGLIGGLILALLASVKNPVVRWPLMAWVDFFRAFPPLVLLILLFAGLPFAGLELGGFVCVAIAFFLNTGAYYGEILRAGIDSVPAGQIEAARSTGLSRLQAMTYVVLPQAVRNVLPDLLSNTLEVVKLTALGSVVAVPELLYQARQAQSLTYSPTPIVVAAIVYFLMLWPVVRLLSRLENRALARR